MDAVPDRLKEALADRYPLERELGRGGMATVYLGRDLKHDRLVAVKVLRSEYAAGLGIGRFLREIDIAAGMTHPHILPLYDSGEADGFLYYVMPYVSGESLHDRIAREAQLPLDEAVGTCATRPPPCGRFAPGAPAWHQISVCGSFNPVRCACAQRTRRPPAPVDGSPLLNRD